MTIETAIEIFKNKRYELYSSKEKLSGNGQGAEDELIEALSFAITLMDTLLVLTRR